MNAQDTELKQIVKALEEDKFEERMAVSRLMVALFDFDPEVAMLIDRRSFRDLASLNDVCRRVGYPQASGESIMAHHLAGLVPAIERATEAQKNVHLEATDGVAKGRTVLEALKAAHVVGFAREAGRLVISEQCDICFSAALTKAQAQQLIAELTEIVEKL